MENVDEVKGKALTQPEKIDMIINGACDFFGITKEGLMEKRGTRSKYWEYKRYFVPLLFDHTSATHTVITKLLNYVNHSNSSQCYARMKNELSDNIYGYDKTKKVYKELLTYLNLDNEKNCK